MSVLDSLPAEATPEDIAEAIAALTPEQARAEDERLKFDWATWARREQVLPDGDWRTWLLLGGRGSGKTRPAAEAVRVWARDPASVIALVGPTSNDVTKVMIRGESGLLGVSPPSERPSYTPSNRELRWPSGARGYTYSAEEPERLRGPQHTHAWCLIGDTQVTMADNSQKRLADVAVGDRVRSRAGATQVTAKARTGRNAALVQLVTVGGRSIIGTSDHPVYVARRGFVPLSDLTPGMFLCASNALSGMDTCGTATARATMREKSGYTGPFGKPPTGAYPMVTKSITSTATKRITGLKTLSCSRMASIAVSICPRKSRPSAGRSAGGGQSSNLRKNGKSYLTTARWSAPGVVPDIRVPHSIHPPIARPSAWKPPDRVHFPVSAATAPFAVRRIRQASECNSIARKSAIPEPPPPERRNCKSASCVVSGAGKDSQVSALMPGFAGASAPWSTTQLDRVASVRNLAICADVYDITTVAGEFFADGILVHNCDEIAAYPNPGEVWDLMIPGMRLGTNPRWVASTTPKPLPFLYDLMSDPTTVVSRMTTWDNAANLPPALLDLLRKRYSGTRIGRQELEGQLLEEAEGALWTRSMLDKNRVSAAPELVRVVVAIDPAVTSGENADETGIIVAGLGMDGEGYVLDDGSCRLPPAQWATRAISLLDHHTADKIVAEVNNGGEMVEQTLRTIRQTVPYKAVHASRGKTARAEPVASLYEQARVHHVGAFRKLEDEMTSWVPGKLTRSPNRADALVWAIAFLMPAKAVHMGQAFLL